ncbi:hypothetical protein D3C85_365990 [compost metagenome]
MKNLFYCLLLSLFYFQTNAQTASEPSLESVSTTTVTPEEQNDYDVEELPWYRRRFKFTAGAFMPINNTEIRVGNSDGSIGTSIDLEDDLGFTESTASFLASFEWRVSRRSRFNLEYFYLNRDATKTIDKDIEFGDEVYPVDARVSAFFDTQIIRFAYSYAILSKPKYEAGLLLGAHVLMGDMGLKVEANGQTAEVKDDFDFTAPLPDVGIWGEFVISKRFGAYANVNYLSAKVDNVDGSIISYNVSVLYNVYKNFNLTAGYTGLSFDLDVEKENRNGYIKWGYNGPAITASYNFGAHVKSKK